MDSEYKLNLIFNRSIQDIIGINNELFTGITEDFAHFKEKTLNKIVVMGYNTFKSLPGGKPINLLSDRLNIVISNNHYDILNEDIEKCDENLDMMVYKTFDDFYSDLTHNRIDFKDREIYSSIKDIFIIGGSHLYYYVYDNFPINIIYETIVDVSISIDDYANDRNKITYFNRVIDDKKYMKIYSKERTADINISMGLHKGTKKEKCYYRINTYQNKEEINLQELEYLKLLKSIYNEGVDKAWEIARL